MPNTLSLKLLTSVGDGGATQTYTILDLLESYVFAGQDIRLYNPTKAYAKGTRVILPSNLSGSTTTHVYEAGAAIAANQAFSLANWKVASVATQLTDVTGVMSTLTTAQKTTLVGAINELVSTIATNLTASKTYTDTKITDLIGGSGEALDTLKELATALNNDPNFASTMTAELAKKSNIGHTHAPADVIETTDKQFVSKTQKDFWDAKASTALATRTTAGLFSPTDKVILDDGQQWRLTNNNGSGKSVQGADFNLTITSGMYNVVSTDANGLGIAGTLVVSTRASSGVFQLFHGTDGVLATRNSNDTGATWSTWKRQADINTLSKVIMGNKLVDVSNITFVGKVSGSVVVNPHIFYRAAGVLAGPTVGVEQNATELARIISEDTVSSVYNAATTAGTVSAHKFHFNIVEHIERTYGIIPAATLAEKVAWVKKNISELAVIWTGNGSSASGNKATVRFWNGTAWVQFNNNAITTAASPTRVSDKVLTPAQMDLAIDNTGFAYVAAYGEPSDGTTASSISTDYIQLNVTLSTDMRTTLLMNNLQGYKITADDGLAKAFGATDMNALTETGVYYTNGSPLNAPGSGYYLVEVFRADNSTTFLQKATEVLTNIQYIRTATPSTGFRQWDCLTGAKTSIAALMGNSQVDKTTASYRNKVSGSTVVNPHFVKYMSSSSGLGATILTPYAAWTGESASGYAALAENDGQLFTSGNQNNATYAQQLFAFNLVEHVERLYGTIAGATLADKIAWLKTNVTRLVFNWWGNGSSGAGNKATTRYWHNTSSSWVNPTVTTSATTAKLAQTVSAGAKDMIDVNGLIYFNAVAEPSNGTAFSTINTDFVELEVELTTSWLSRLTSAPVRGKIDLANTAGVVNITLNGETGVIDAKVVNINGAAAETQTGAQAKATAAETTAKAYTDTSVGAVVAAAPNVLNTLQKLAAAINNDANYFTTIANQFTNHTQPASSIVESTTRRFATDVQIAFWNAKASTALATQSTAGLMSPTDKTIFDNGQQWKITESNGSGILLATGTDMNTITTGRLFRVATDVNSPLPNEGTIWYLVENLVHDASYTIQRATVFTNGRIGESFNRGYNNGKWMPWKKTALSSDLGRIVLNNTFTEVTVADFVDKTRASVVNNPHIFKGSRANALSTPIAAMEVSTQTLYNEIQSLDGTASIPWQTGTTGEIAQHIFAFNLIEHVSRTYGAVPGGTVADQVAWLKKNISRLTLNWWGYGTAPTGAKSSLAAWYNNAWGTPVVGTQTTATRQSIIISAGGQQYMVDANGFIYFIAYAEASNGSVASTIATDYLNLTIELTTTLKDNLLASGVQGYRLTDDNGYGRTLPDGTDFRTVNQAGFYRFVPGKATGSPDDSLYWNVTVVQFDNENSTQMWQSVLTHKMYYALVRADGIRKNFRELVDANTLSSALMGNSEYTQENVTFINKVTNNTGAVPHTIYYNTTLATTPLPASFGGTEFNQSAYDTVAKRNGTAVSVQNATNGGIAQMKISFNIIDHVERTLGLIPATSVAGKVAWLRANINDLWFNWYGRGTGPTGNKATLMRLNGVANSWYAPGTSTTSATVAKLSIAPTPSSNAIDDTGFAHLVAYAEASNGTIPSVIYMEFTEMIIGFNVDILTTLVSKTIKGKLSLGDPAGTEMIALDGATGRADFKSGYINGQAIETQSGAQAKATAALNTAKSYTDTKVADLVASSPAALDTLKELADALGNDPNFATSVATQLGNKSDVGHKHATSDILTNASAQFVTSTQVANWEGKETVGGAQAKANTAEANAKTYADGKASAIVDGAPATLDTIKKLASAINNDPAIATTLKAYTDTKSLAAQNAAVDYAKNLNSVNIADTRDVDGAPNTYMATGTGTTANGKGVYYEFKKKGIIGLSTAAGSFILLKTIAKWSDTSGGQPVQVAYDDAGTVYTRAATSETTWSAWLTQETTAGAQTKATAALTSAKSYTDTQVALINGTPPATLNSLQKLAAAINNDPAVYTTLTNAINGKANTTHQHAPSDIATTAAARFVSDTQIASWVAKADASVTITAGAGLTGGGSLAASRTISVSFAGTGSATTVSRSDHTHTNILSLGKVGTPTGRSINAMGIHTYTTYNEGAVTPVTYGEVLSYGDNAGRAEILTSWSGVPKMYVRSLRDTVDSWTAWTQIWTAGDFDHTAKTDKTTTITAGAGLTGGGDLSTNRTLAVSFGGTGAASTVARSDHNHDSTYLKQTGGTLTGDVTSTANMTVKTHTAERVEVKSTTTTKKAYMRYNDAEDSLDFIFE